jgi:uncharacterized LabA/DUF88 family protein
MTKCVILVDNSNVFIEGQKASAKAKGIVPATLSDKQLSDIYWRIDFASLLSELAEGRPILEAFLVGSRPPPKDAVWEMAKQGGFKVITHDRDSHNREKAVDTELAVQGTMAVAMAPEPGVLVIASGDRDFIPLVKMAQSRGWSAEMAAFGSSFSGHGEMATTVNRIRLLDTVIGKIGHCGFSWP